MKTFRGDDVPARLVDPKSFVGTAYTRRLADGQDGTPVIVYHVAFDPGARTNWHSHSGAQWLLIIEGHIRVQRWGEAPHEVSAGDVVMIGPGEKHWHGAAPGTRGVHLAINVNATTEWLEPVTDDEYGYSPTI
jgi:quercetin dioxygenase-like cupin family protein